MKKRTVPCLLAALMLALAACSGGVAETAESLPSSVAAGVDIDSAVESLASGATGASPIAVTYDPEDLDASASSADVSYIRLEGSSIAVEGSGATVNGSIVTITSAGTYNISGSLDDGQIVVDSADEETVVLVLDGADINASTSAPIYVLEAEKAVITLADGSENRVADGATYHLADGEDEPNAAIFSKSDLTINGGGSLIVQANYNNGIASKDDLKIISGSIMVQAVNDGIRGRDSIAVRDASIVINAGADGMQSNNDEDSAKGYISIEGGTLEITAGLDGIQAETRLAVSGGDITIVTGGGSVERAVAADFSVRGQALNAVDTGSTVSTKGLKAGVDLTITGGTFHIDSLDDSVHSNGSLTIDGGDLLLASGDDALHADNTLTVNGGELNITRSYEGIESSLITINGGEIRVVASDDGVNASSGTGGEALFGQPGQGGFEAGDNSLVLNGGYLAVDAMGDGLDINGPIAMSGGVVLVNGPTANNNGALDYAGAFEITGGLFVAVGSAGMAQAPSASSTQYSIMHTFESVQAAGTLIHIESEDGEELLTFMPTKKYQTVVYSSPDLQSGSSYAVYSGGDSSGTVTDSLYSGGTYSGGAQVASFTISTIVTSTGARAGDFMGGPGGGRPARP